MIGKPVLTGDFEEVGRGIAQVAGGAEDRADAISCGNTVATGAVGLGDAIGEHGLRAGCGNGGFGGCDEGIGVLAVDHHGNAGVGAELARAEGERPGPAFRDGVSACGEGGGEKEHRVHGAKFAEEGDRFGPLGAEVEEGAAPGEGAGEADGLDEGVLDQRLAHVALAALHQGEGAGGHVGRLDGGVDGLGDDLAGSGVGRVALDDDRTTGGEGGGGVAPGGGEGEGEVRGAEHGHGADGALDQFDVGPRGGLAVGEGGVVAAVEPVVLEDVAGEEAELHGGATAFALQPGGGEAGFLGADLGDLCAPRLDLVSDAVQEVCPVLAGLRSVGGEGGFGGVTGCVHMGRGADRELVRRTVGRGGGEGLVVPDPVARDQVFAGQHGGLLVRNRRRRW